MIIMTWLVSMITVIKISNGTANYIKSLIDDNVDKMIIMINNKRIMMSLLKLTLPR